MTCEHPILALRFNVLNENGKSMIKILPASGRPDYNIRMLEERYGKDCLIKLPCGRCTSCKEAYRMDWSIRCDMEKLYHKESCFLTLTYRDDVCPRWVSKQHVRKFIRKLRRSGIECSYFACGEYGEQNGRPHYHLILFGYFPGDAVLKPDVKTKSGYEVYSSPFLDRIWKKGFVVVNNFARQEAFYVAGYVNKKTGKYDGFIMMSNGIGYQYMTDHIKELFKNRYYIASNGHVFQVPRAFKRVLEKNGYFSEEDPEQVITMRKVENSEMLKRGLTNREQLFSINGMKMKDKLTKRLKRL